MASTLGRVALGIVGVIVFVLLLIGGRELGWWLKADNVNRQVEITNNNTGVQTAWADQVRTGIREFEVLDPSNTAQRGAIANDVCALIPRLNDNYLDVSFTVFAQENC